MKKFCITGGIACGKSEVSRFLSLSGWEVIDTDLIAREQLEPGSEGYKKVVDAFGNNILNEDHLVDRTLLGRVVFSDPEKRNLLNAILHPLIRSVWQHRLQQHLRNFPEVPVVVVIPLLFETRGEGEFDSVACVATPIDIQLERLRQRGMTDVEAGQRIRAQEPQGEKIKKSQVLLWNSGSLELLKRQTELLKKVWLKRRG